MRPSTFFVLAAALTALASTTASAAPVFFGPTPYLSPADIPAGFYAGGPSALENFEDGVLSFGIVASSGGVLNPSPFTDSVDADDGAINGDGTRGRSWLFGPPSVTFTFTGPLPTAAGLVWTDGAVGPVTFQAFGPGMTLLGTYGPFTLGDSSFFGTTAEDRFFGVQDPGGILAIRLLSDSPVNTELDHVQFGFAPAAAVVIPEPGGLVLFGAAVAGALGAARRRRESPAA